MANYSVISEQAEDLNIIGGVLQKDAIYFIAGDSTFNLSSINKFLIYK